MAWAVHCTARDEWRVDINHSGVPAEHISYEFGSGGAAAEMPQVWVEIPLSACPAFCGDNQLGLTWLGDGGSSIRMNVPFMEELIVTVEPHEYK